MRIVLLSNHYYNSPRRAGFHHLADALHRAGHQVTFVTTGLSWISYARRDYRTRYAGLHAARNRLRTERPGLDSYVHFTCWHPHTTLFSQLDRLLDGLMDRYERYPLGPVEPRIAMADAIFYESSTALFLFRKCLRAAPGALHIYRVSDDVRILRSPPPRLAALEAEIAPCFHCVSVPCAYLADKFHGLPNVRLHRHGIDKADFDAVKASPYRQVQNNCIFVGNSHLDADFVRNAATALPDVHFHVIGPLRQTAHLPNVHHYGEMPFRDTLPYIKYADVGLQTREQSGIGVASLTDSLKVIQYRYCGLPIVAPDFLDLRREGVSYYSPGDAPSAAEAVRQTLRMGRNSARSDEVRSWDEVAADILADAAAFTPPATNAASSDP